VLPLLMTVVIAALQLQCFVLRLGHVGFVSCVLAVLICVFVSVHRLYCDVNCL